MQESEAMQPSNCYHLVYMLLILALAGPCGLTKFCSASDVQDSRFLRSDVEITHSQRQRRNLENEDGPDIPTALSSSSSSGSSDQNSPFLSTRLGRKQRDKSVFANRISELKENLQRHLEATTNLLLTLQSIDVKELEDNRRFIRCASKFLPSFSYSRHLNSDDEDNNQSENSTSVEESGLEENNTNCSLGQFCRENESQVDITTPNTPHFSSQFTNRISNSSSSTTTTSTLTTEATPGPFFPPRPDFPPRPNLPPLQNIPPRPHLPPPQNFPRQQNVPRPQQNPTPQHNFPPRPNFPPVGRSSPLTNVDKDNLEKIGDTPVRAEESLKVFREHMSIEEYERLMENRPQLPPPSMPRRPFSDTRKRSSSRSCGSYKNCLQILTSLREWKK